jgi:hypothetical protein
MFVSSFAMAWMQEVEHQQQQQKEGVNSFFFIFGGTKRAKAVPRFMSI